MGGVASRVGAMVLVFCPEVLDLCAGVMASRKLKLLTLLSAGEGILNWIMRQLECGWWASRRVEAWEGVYSGERV